MCFFWFPCTCISPVCGTFKHRGLGPYMATLRIMKAYMIRRRAVLAATNNWSSQYKAPQPLFMSPSLSEGSQCELYKVDGPIQGTKEDKAELAAVPQTHNQNRNQAKGEKGGGGGWGGGGIKSKRDRERINSSAEYICCKLIKSESMQSVCCV